MDDAFAVYRAPNAQTQPLPQASADDFEPTPGELRAAFADAINQRHGPNAPLMTSAMRAKRDAEIAKRKPQYTSVKVRVRFADRSQVEKTFDVGARIDQVYMFVDSLLEETVAYTLFQSPPRREFPVHARETLGQLGFAPAAVLGVRWEDARLNASDALPPLKADVRARARDMPISPALGADAGGAGAGTSAGKHAGAPGGPHADGESRERKVPKWFRSTGASLRAAKK
ncbi:hypothetical protein MCUN1_003825 [Malassezia cuniculi]|uniref:UBX domain-containing protein n=1 Tax=Malassezia cuniculi TaxID=948313 RepID=A0AAF0ETR5_9BASI|nr:hypothetical protein MCUN1_003825 [Malassezia cuniculi]